MGVFVWLAVYFTLGVAATAFARLVHPSCLTSSTGNKEEEWVLRWVAIVFWPGVFLSALTAVIHFRVPLVWLVITDPAEAAYRWICWLRKPKP